MTNIHENQVPSFKNKYNVIQGAPLLTWINFDTSIDKLSHAQ